MNRLLIPILLLLVACSETEPEIQDLRTDEEREAAQQESEVANEPSITLNDSLDDSIPPVSASNFSYKIIEVDHGWGYQIYDGSTMLIKQEHIPSVPGINGFETQEKAEIAAKYVLDQVQEGNFPPTVSPEILESIGAL